MKMRLITLLTIVAGTVLLVSLAFVAQKPRQLAYALPGSRSLTLQDADTATLGGSNVISPTDYTYLPWIHQLLELMP